MQKQRFLALRQEIKANLFRPYNDSPTQKWETNALVTKDQLKDNTIIWKQEIDEGFQQTPKSQTQKLIQKKTQDASSLMQSDTLNLPKTQLHQSPPSMICKRSVVHENMEFSHVYEQGEEIGQGGHAVVKRCFKRVGQDETEYAVKIFRSGDPEIINTIKKTFQNNLKLVHPNVCKAYELFIDERSEQCYFVSEYCPWPSLEQILIENKKLTFKQARNVIINLLETLVYLHKEGIAHRDIKPDNILVHLDEKSSCSIKLIDFGVSKRFRIKKTDTEISMWTRTGNIFYQAPESFRGGGYDEKVDIWSVGVVLYQSIVGHLPFESDQIIDTIEIIQQAKLDSVIIQSLPKLFIDLMNRIFRPNPIQRLSAKECLMHPWFKQEHQDDDRSFQKMINSKDDASLNFCASPHIGNIDVSKSTMETFLTPDFRTTKQNPGIDLASMQIQGKIHHIEKDQPKRSRFRAFSMNENQITAQIEKQISNPQQQWLSSSSIAESPLSSHPGSNSISPVVKK